MRENIAALLTRMSIRPKASRTSCAMRFVAAASDTSATTPIALCRRFVSSAETLAHAASSTSTMTTLAPSSARRSA
jgi:hypothetical protein